MVNPTAPFCLCEVNNGTVCTSTIADIQFVQFVQDSLYEVTEVHVHVQCDFVHALDEVSGYMYVISLQLTLYFLLMTGR